MKSVLYLSWNEKFRAVILAYCTDTILKFPRKFEKSKDEFARQYGDKQTRDA